MRFQLDSKGGAHESLANTVTRRLGAALPRIDRGQCSETDDNILVRSVKSIATALHENEMAVEWVRSLEEALIAIKANSTYCCAIIGWGCVRTRLIRLCNLSN
ncbi:hypothetical protein THH46_15505 [Pseudomonas sp. NA13]